MSKYDYPNIEFWMSIFWICNIEHTEIFGAIMFTIEIIFQSMTIFGLKGQL